MALDKRRDAAWDALVEKAAAEVRKYNPHIDEHPRPLADADCAQLSEDARELERVWGEIERHRGNRPQTYTAADAVDEDRGE